MASIGFALLCSSALEHDGLASILGGGLDRVTAPQFPLQTALTLVARIVWADDELARPHLVATQVGHADGTHLVKLDGTVIPARAPGARSEVPVGLLLIQPLLLDIPRPGRYRVSIAIGGEPAAELPLWAEIAVPQV
jgi:hypothetical protein